MPRKSHRRSKPPTIKDIGTESVLRFVRLIKRTTPRVKRPSTIRRPPREAIRSPAFGNPSTSREVVKAKLKKEPAKKPRLTPQAARSMEKRNLTAQIYFTQARRKRIKVKNLGQVLARLGKRRAEAKRIFRQAFLEERTWLNEGALMDAVELALQREFDPHRITKK